MTRRIITLSILTFAWLFSYSQEPENIIHVDNYRINIDTVPLDRGSVLEKGTTIRKDRWGERTSNYELKLFTCLDRNSYAIVYDTNTNQEGGYYNRVQLFNMHGCLLLDKYFKNASLESCYISSNGNIIVVDLGSEQIAEVHIYKNDGTLLKVFDNRNEELYTGLEHNYFFIWKDTNDLNIYNLINKNGDISEVLLPSGFVRHLEFSRSEKYYKVTIDYDQLLFNINHELIWRYPLSIGLINFLIGDTSISMTRDSRILEVKTLLNQELICSTSYISYNSEKIKAHYYGIMDNFYYLVGDIKGKWIFAFYNFDCEQVFYDLVNKKMTPSVYKVTKNDDKFEIIEKNRPYW